MYEVIIINASAASRPRGGRSHPPHTYHIAHARKHRSVVSILTAAAGKGCAVQFCVLRRTQNRVVRLTAAVSVQFAVVRDSELGSDVAVVRVTNAADVQDVAVAVATLTLFQHAYKEMRFEAARPKRGQLSRLRLHYNYTRTRRVKVPRHTIATRITTRQDRTNYKPPPMRINPYTQTCSIRKARAHTKNKSIFIALGPPRPRPHIRTPRNASHYYYAIHMYRSVCMIEHEDLLTPILIRH